MVKKFAERFSRKRMVYLLNSLCSIQRRKGGDFHQLYGTSYLFVCDPFTPNSARRGRVGTLFLNVDN